MKTPQTLILLILLTGSLLSEETDITPNGDFEQTEVFPSTHVYAKEMKLKDWVTDTIIQKPKGWIVNPQISAGEYRLIENKEEAHSGDVCIFLKGDFYAEKGVNVVAGNKIVFTYWAKGDSRNLANDAICVLYFYSKDEANKDVVLGDKMHFKERISKEWQKYTRTFEIPAEIDKYTSFNVIPAFRSYSGAFFDDFEIQLVTDK